MTHRDARTPGSTIDDVTFWTHPQCSIVSDLCPLNAGIFLVARLFSLF